MGTFLEPEGQKQTVGSSSEEDLELEIVRAIEQHMAEMDATITKLATEAGG